METLHGFTARLSFMVVAFASAGLVLCGGALSGCDEGSTAQTRWAPKGCRTVPVDDDVLPSRVAYRNLHSDEANTDEILDRIRTRLPRRMDHGARDVQRLRPSL